MLSNATDRTCSSPEPVNVSVSRALSGDQGARNSGETLDTRAGAAKADAAPRLAGELGPDTGEFSVVGLAIGDAVDELPLEPGAARANPIVGIADRMSTASRRITVI